MPHLPTAPLRPCIDCGAAPGTRRGRCVVCDRRSPRNHRGVARSLRGHGAPYDRIARALRGQPCALRLPGCTGTATGADLIVPRRLGGLAVWGNVRPACAHCQSVQGGRVSPKDPGPERAPRQ
jgi:hypothetical protein